MKHFTPFILSFFACIFFVQISFAQTNFKRLYHKGNGEQIYQTADDGYLLLTENMATKVDENGRYLWSKIIDQPFEHFIPTADGGYVKTGNIYMTGSGQTDIFITKMDVNGNDTWTKIIGNTQSESASQIFQASDGGYLISGYVKQTTPFVFPPNLEYYFNDMLLVKTDANGNELWRKVVGDVDREEMGLMVTETVDGNYVAVGTKSMDSPPATFFPAIYILKTDAMGNQLDLSLDGVAGVIHKPKTVKPTPDGGYLIAGTREGLGTYLDDAIYVLKKEGTSEWTFQKGGNIFEPSIGNAAAPTPDGGAIVTGRYLGPSTPGASIVVLATLIKLYPDGTEEWSRNIYPQGNDIMVTSDGGYATTGSLNGYLNLVKTNSEGHIPPDNCPSELYGFSWLGDYNGHRYFLSQTVNNWKDARLRAIGNGGYLAVMNDADENEFLKENIGMQVFIGLSDYLSEGNLEWERSQPLYYTNLSTCDWCGLNTDENDYGKMNFWDGSWSFDNELVERPFIVEMACDVNCGCPTNYDPVCGSDGVTYTNPCLAECAGVFDYVPGECQSSCPTDIAGYEFLGEWNGHHYFLSEVGKPWWMAETDALSIGGYLATVGSAGENDFLQQNIYEIVWFGMTDSNTEGQVEWSNGEPLTYTKYSTCDFCGDNSEVRDYGEMNFWDGSWSWDNGTPYRKFLVEIPCMSTTFNSTAFNIALMETEEEKAQTVVEKLFPNPATNNLFAKIESTAETEIVIQIYDALGRLHLEKSATLYNGTNHLEMDIADLPSGVYALFVNDSKRQISQMKFVKQRL